jgi:ribosomal protein S18 acetylase RimI-like enzyme
VIRAARAEDYEAFTRLFAELQIPDPVPALHRFAEVIVPDMSVACGADGAVIGFVAWRKYGAIAHVSQIVVAPGSRGQRVGELLLEHARAAARAAGCSRWYLNVKRDNAPALRLYERVGFRFELETVSMKLQWANVPLVDVRERLIDDRADEDAHIAELFTIPAARVAHFRGRGTFRLVTLRDDDDAILAFAAFSPSHPGAATFCARRPDLAIPLLGAMRRHADPQFDFVRVTVEGDMPLVDAVLDLGAERSFEILRLGAALGTSP